MAGKTECIKKETLMKQWAALSPNQPITDKIRPLPYKHEGSTYGEDGIRIDGSQEFIFAVLSRLQDLLDLEAVNTRLSVSMSEIATRTKIGNGVQFGDGTGNWCCYIRCAERGRKGKIVAAIGQWAASAA